MGLFDFAKKKKEKSISIAEKANMLKSSSAADNGQAIGYEKDRYNAGRLSDMWLKADKSGKTIVIDDIEIEQYYPELEDMMRSFWMNISDIDNRVQQFCIENFDRLNDDIKNYIVELSWVSLEENQVELGYWGKYVNAELRAICNYEDDHWMISEIYYQ